MDQIDKLQYILGNLQLENKKIPKGSRCSKEGNNYEKIIYNTIKNKKLNGNMFNTQSEKELGGSSSKNDIECNFEKHRDVGIEIKKFNTPDWMQCTIKYDKDVKKWIPSKKGKIPKECSDLFEKIINNINLYNGEIPPFVEKNITHQEWLQIKGTTDKWKDVYADIPNNIIKELYKKKGCFYIQISNGYGLYHLGEDICKFGVPEFITEQQIRIRTKIHSRKNKKGFCSISVTAASQPKNIKNLIPSNYSLDCEEKLPCNLS
jgi:hypothetical protein